MTPPLGTRHGIFLLLRRLRPPLVVLIAVYAVAVLGFTLVPGTDPSGQPWKMSFLHAFYFVSFLGTTIGLGEIPFPFSDPQRLWATASIYATVIAWLYAIGALFSALGDPMFRRIVHESRMERAVRRIKEPFYLLCGYGDAGAHVARELAGDGTRVVVMDASSERIDALDTDDLPVTVPALCGDATEPRSLVLAGLTSPHCVGVIALTGDDFVNTKITLTARLLNPNVPVLCAAHDHATHARMAAVGASQIINPSDNFAARVALAVRTPSQHVIYESLTTRRGTAMGEPIALPRGLWLLCGSGLFVRTLRRELKKLDIDTVLIDNELDFVVANTNLVKGDPTDPEVLERAGIDKATAVVAGTDVDVDNLAIVLTTRSLSKSIFIVARQTQRRNSSVFRAAPADLVTLSGYVIAAEVLRFIRAPQLATFLRQARDQDEEWSAALLAKMRDVIGDAIVESWSVHLCAEEAPAICNALKEGKPLSIESLLARTGTDGKLLRAIPLLLQNGSKRELLPALDTALTEDDRVLFCGKASARMRMRYGISSG